MTVTIGRRELLAALGGAAAAWPLAARAQRPAKLPTIGFLGASTPSGWSQWTAAFVQRLGELGWIEGRTVAIEYRWAEGRSERYADIAAVVLPFHRRICSFVVSTLNGILSDVAPELRHHLSPPSTAHQTMAGRLGQVLS